MIHPKGEPEKARPVPYRCRSWRHEGDCRQFKGAQDFCRIRDGIAEHDNWCFLTLTFAQSEWWDWKEQYTLAVDYWSKLRLRLRRLLFKKGTKRRHIPYVQTWERHQVKGIHAHILLSNSQLLEACTGDWQKHKHHIEPKKIVDAILKDKQSWHSKVLVPHCVDCGFGPRCYCQPMRSGTGEGMAGYLVKLAKELTGQGAKNQIPIDAPPHFRRLRASRGLLPPVIKGDMGGYLVCLPLDECGTPTDEYGEVIDRASRRKPRTKSY